MSGPSAESTGPIENTGCQHIQEFLGALAAQGMTLADLDQGAVEWLAEVIVETPEIVEGAEMSTTIDDGGYGGGGASTGGGGDTGGWA